MRLLLDTHIAAWAVLGNSSLPRRVAALIADAENDVAVSMARLWEIAIKNNLVRVVRDPFGLTLAQAIEEFAAALFTIAPIDTNHLAEVERLPWLHGDPFDRLLVATAITDTWRLVTHDDKLAGYGVHVIVV